MDKVCQVNLVSVVETQNTIGEIVTTESSTSVIATISSISRQEFFECQKNGVNASLVATMFKYDYNDEKIVIIDNKRYYVYRTYDLFDDSIELYLEQRTGISYAS